MVLYSPAGGARYRIAQHARFARHLSFVAERSLVTVTDLALSSGQGFTQDPRVGPWVNCVRGDPAFADGYRAIDKGRYETLVAGMARTLFDRDTVPGPEPEDLLRLDVRRSSCLARTRRTRPRRPGTWRSACRAASTGTCR
jgi:hypothetical protein